MMTEAEVRAQIEALRRQRAEYIAQAERQLAMLDGALQALEGVIAPKPEPAEDA